MVTRTLFLLLAGLVLFCAGALADAPLKTALDLDMDQAKAVAEIQAHHRELMRAKRHDFHTDSRRLRRARIANDSKAVAELEAITAKQQAEMRAILDSEDAAIRKLLNPEQSKKFDKYIETRESMVGSSRDVSDMKRKP